MKVILQSDVKNIGKIGDVINVKKGFARNFLLPNQLALKATTKSLKHQTYINKLIEVKKKQALNEKQKLLNEISKIELSFKRASGKGNKLFGSVTVGDIAKKLELEKHLIDKKDIYLVAPIKSLGEHKAKIKLSPELEGEIKILVEKG